MRVILLALVVVVIAALTACGAEDPPALKPITSVSSSAPMGADAAADGFPEGFTYPPGATVRVTAPGFTGYMVADAEVSTIEDYWRPHLESLGFNEADSTDISRFFSRGTTMIQITWNQAGDEVRGAANVLTP